MPSLEEIFLTVEDGKAVRVALPLKNSPEKKRLSCVYQKQTPPRFSLLFPAGSLPLESIDTHRKVSVIFDLAGQSISVAADIESIPSEQLMHLVGRQIIEHEQLRDFFRVDVATPLVARPAHAELLASEEKTWTITGETIDVSAGGLLAKFPKPLDRDRRVKIELVLPTGKPEPVEAIAHVVRIQKIHDDLYHIAFRFDQITPEDQDRIMACCFEIQRRHLRLKVQVKDPDL